MFPKHIKIHKYEESSLLDSGIDIVHTLKKESLISYLGIIHVPKTHKNTQVQRIITIRQQN